MSASLRQDPAVASAVRQRQSMKNDASVSEAPASLSTDPKKKVPRSEPKIKPPFANVSMNKFLLNLMLVVLAVAGFYIWRVTVWAHESGGYWALITGSGSAVKAAASSAASASSFAAAAVTAATSTASSAARTAKTAAHATSGAPADVQAQIFSLAAALGVPLADLSNAIRPLIDPTVPNPVDEVKRLRDQLELSKHIHEQTVQQHEEIVEKEEAKKPSVLELMEEAFLD
ncbi:hypothetical protein QFC22_003577 [Naganishia vaughanmartiniae]|uniref:Uncharacterized protein n=1 Tax=Naganishia vaughanmartiniae TaxID=1424756 RepID=A0ACC2X6N5_9TREE|nr:hypothetical protein QFC22_003577 [Naganishia vaughanmartiniae]